MKKTMIISAALLGVTFAAGAQTVSDALRYSENNYLGTARSIGLGNAVTALGGDLGTVGINPAGSAVSKFWQIEFTPALSISASDAKYNPNPSASSNYASSTDNSTRFTFPNFGMNMYFPTGQRSGLKGVSFGFIFNSTNNFQERFTGHGQNGSTSYLGYLATAADGYKESDLKGADYASSIPWDLLVGYRSGMIAGYGTTDGKYIGTTEKQYSDGSIMVASNLNQRYAVSSHGQKYDPVLNLGFNISDIFYFGFNLGLTTFDYQTKSTITETAVDPASFEVNFEKGTAYFSDASYRNRYSAYGDGVYGKFGFIVLPTNNLRIGAAIQTPTSIHMVEKYHYYGETNFTDSGYDSWARSDDGRYEYRLITPYSANVGLAYTFPKGFISADYEMTDYSTMKFKEDDDYDVEGTFDRVNDDIRDYTGMTHEVRMGGEFMPMSDIAFRAGYGFRSSAERYYDALGDKKSPDAYTHTVSFGLGYSSPGSFFMDFACQALFRSKQYYYPYPDYIKDVKSPEIKLNSQLWTFAMTFGWRF